jgi:hypothetical protein
LQLGNSPVVSQDLETSLAEDDDKALFEQTPSVTGHTASPRKVPLRAGNVMLPSTAAVSALTIVSVTAAYVVEAGATANPNSKTTGGATTRIVEILDETSAARLRAFEIAARNLERPAPRQ